MVNLKNLNLLFLAVILTLTNFAATNAAKKSSHQIVVEALSAKLQKDLAIDAISIKLGKVSQYQISKSQIGIRGDGTATLAVNSENLPIIFNVKINKINFDVADVKYNFPAADVATPGLSAFAMEDAVTLKLLEKIGADYKTANVVVAIENFNTQKKAAGETELTGEGDVRLSDFEWRKVQFAVSLDKNGAIAKVSYRVQE